MPSNHLILCHLHLLPPSIFPSIRFFSNESVLRVKWPKYWSFSFSISPYDEYSGLISFRMNGFDLLAFQGTFKSLLQHHSSKASILWRSAFFIVQLSHPYLITRKTNGLTRQTFVDKVMSLLFNMLSSWSDLHTFKKGVGEGNGTPLQYSCLENPMDRGAWWAAVHGVAKRHDWVTSLSCIGEGKGNPLQCSCQENPQDGGAWWAAICGVAQSLTRLKWSSSSSSKKGVMWYNLLYNLVYKSETSVF